MAQFELSLIHFINTHEIAVPFTYFNTNTIIQNKQIFNDEYIYTPSQEQNNSLYNYSFNEHFTLHKNAQAELSFSMFKYINLETKFVINPFATTLKTGSIIKLVDQFNVTRYFWVKDISYKFTRQNIEYQFKCQDYFSYTYTRKNNGYEIINNVNDNNFIGAKTIDDWVQYIINDCGINYTYLPLKESPWQNYNVSTVFTVSSSNAYNALVELANKHGLIIEIKEYVDDDNNIIKQFWLKPEKNPHYNGLEYSPYYNIKDFSLSQSGNSLISVLNVAGQPIGNNYLSLLNEIPLPLILDCNSTRWSTSKYYTGFYKDYLGPNYLIDTTNNTLPPLKVWDYVQDYSIIQDGQYGIKEFIPQDVQTFLTLVDKIPWLENKIINFEYFYTNHLMSDEEYHNLWNLLTNDLRIANGQLLYYNYIYQNTIKETNHILFDIDQRITTYGAQFQHIVINTIEQDKEKIYNAIDWADINKLFTNNQDIYNNWQTIYNQFIKSPKKHQEILDINHVISKYGTKFIQQQQRFLHNVYLLQNYHFTTDFSVNNISWKNKTLIEFCSIDNVGWNWTFPTDTIYLPDLEAIKQYWTECYNASQFCEYYIPEKWDITLLQNGQINQDNYNAFIGDNIIKYENKQGTIKKVYSQYKYWTEINIDMINIKINELSQNNWKWKELPIYHSVDSYTTKQCIDYSSRLTQVQWLDTDIKEQKNTTDWVADNFIWLVINVNDSTIPQTYLSLQQIVDETHLQPQQIYCSIEATTSNELLAKDTLDNYKTAEGWWTGENEIQDNWYEISNKAKYKPKTWNDLKAKMIYQNHPYFSDTYFNVYGQYPLYLQILLKDYIDNQYHHNTLKFNYECALKKHNEIWDKIYQTYGRFLLEGEYKDATATTSVDLYTNASNYFKDLSQPEYQYNLSIINSYSLKGYKGERLNISDQIHIAADEFYGELDDLKNIIKQPLFITDIDYDLRSDEEIKITVNTIKYQDKVIQKLVSLIK